MEKSKQIFSTIKYQKKALNVLIKLTVKLIDSIYRRDKNHCLQVFLKEFKYIVNKKDI